MKVIRELTHGAEIDCLRTMYPSRMRVLQESTIIREPTSTFYLYVVKGIVMLIGEHVNARLHPGGYASGPLEELEINISGPGAVVLIERRGFRGQMVTGKIETKGRLSYIDGCSDSMLVYPPRMGDPVFNHLHFPGGVVQTQHTHPSIRLGIVARGNGHAFQKASEHADGWEFELSTGCVFMLEEQELHSFRTDKSKSTMDVIAFHPDSDWGPTDAGHPMLNRTYIGNQR